MSTSHCACRDTEGGALTITFKEVVFHFDYLHIFNYVYVVYILFIM